MVTQLWFLLSTVTRHIPLKSRKTYWKLYIFLLLLCYCCRCVDILQTNTRLYSTHRGAYIQFSLASTEVNNLIMVEIVFFLFFKMENIESI